MISLLLKKLAICLAIIICTLPVLALEHPLVLKAKEIALANSNWIPGNVTSTTTVSKKSGKVTESSSFEIEYQLADNDSIVGQIISIIEDDKNVIEKKMYKYEAEIKSDVLLKDDPSLYCTPDTLDIALVDSLQMINGISCHRFSFSYTNDENGNDIVMHKEFWLDSRTGVPVKDVTTLDPIPIPMAKNMQITQYYSYNEAENIWLNTHNEIEITISALIITRLVKTTISNDNYWRYDKE